MLGVWVWGVVGEARAAMIDWDMSERRRDARFCDFVNLSNHSGEFVREPAGRQKLE